MNKAHGWTDYQARLARVTAYLHEHLAEDLSLHTLAEVAHLSPCHWHRVYHALHGETITATVRRLRLHRGAGYLANTGLSVAEVARQCGYPQGPSFARAFRQAYGMSPADYRRHGGHVLFQAGAADPAAAGYEVELRQVPAVTVAGLAHRGSYMRVGQAFELAWTRLQALGLAAPGARWLAEYLDDPFLVPEAQLASRAGLSVPAGTEVQSPLTTWQLGGGPCAVLRHRGPYATMRAAYQWLYGRWVVQSGVALANAPVWEEYLNNPRDTAPADLLTDICLPLAEP